MQAHPTFEVSPTAGCVALFAARTKLAVVGVIAAVAGNAIAANRCCILSCGCCLLVATLAADFAVCAFEPVFGLGVMVETPDGPGSGVVAGVAAHTKFL